MVAVFGPGFGESIAIRVPPGHWIIVDSLGEPRADPTEIPALEFVRTMGESTDAIVLTHPHADHATGLDRLIMEHVAGPIGCAPLWLDTAEPDLHAADREGLLEATRKAKAQRAIAARWEDQPETRWELHAGSSRRIGDAWITALHPDDAALAEVPSDVNALSTPLLLEWFDVRILLGADLLTDYWPSAGAVAGTLTDSVFTKVPHHGSSTGIADAWSAGSDRPLWVITPFNKGKKLPSFGERDGVEAMLERVEEVHLTALGRTLSGPVPTDRRMSLANVRRATGGTTRRGITFRSMAASPLASAWIAAAFEPAGTIAGNLRRGPAAFTILRDR